MYLPASRMKLKCTYYIKEDHRSYRRNFCSCEKKAWKKFRLVRDSSLWPLRYQCSTLPITLTSQLWAGRWIGSLSVNPWKDNDEVTNIWKSYMRTAGWRIIWKFTYVLNFFFLFQCSVHLDDLFELLCSDSVLLYDYETAESMLKTLEEKAEGKTLTISMEALKVKSLLPVRAKLS